jgi:N-acetylmuramoyl-L-alanine amidase CwlA
MVFYFTLLDFLKFAVDDEEIGRITPLEGGFWEVGEFNSTIGTANNPWIHGTKMAPFDKEVS